MSGGILRVLKMCQCGPLQEGLDARIQKKEQARLQQLKEAAQAHKAQELERKYAVRYHKVHGPETARTVLTTAAPVNQ